MSSVASISAPPRRRHEHDEGGGDRKDVCADEAGLQAGDAAGRVADAASDLDQRPLHDGLSTSSRSLTASACAGREKIAS